MKTGIFISLLLVSNYINAAPVAYDETINGDLTGLPDSATYVGALDVGINTVSGSTSFSDFDKYRFTVGENQILGTLSLNYDSTIVESNLSKQFVLFSFVGDYCCFLNDLDLLGTFSYGGDGFITNDPWLQTPYLNSGDTLTAFTGALTAGDYVIVDSGSSIVSPYQDSGAFLEYTWTMDVTAVPVPASFWLMFSGLAGMASIARRK